MQKNINIGLIGFGCVGQGLFHVLNESPAFKARIVSICDKDLQKAELVPEIKFTTQSDDILNDPEINLVVELIDNADAAYAIVKSALLNKKSVVSANKKMLAHHLPELVEIQKATGVALLYEASACGSIPIIRNLEEYYDNDLLQSIYGILNGSSNYILTRMFSEKLPYVDALKKAQELGFAESNPLMDVGGFDSLFKLIIIAAHAFGVIVKPDEVLNYGISNISPYDFDYAREKGYKLKLIGNVTKVNNDQISMFVLPTFITEEDNLYSVEHQFNGVVIEGKFYDKQFMFGKGAGGNPTGSAVLSDITARIHDYRYEYKKMAYHKKLTYTTDIQLSIYLRWHDEQDLKLFNFKEITEQFRSKNYNYIKGNVLLSDLVKLKVQLTERNIFIVYTGESK